MCSFFSSRQERVIGRMCLLFWVSRTCSKRNLRLGLVFETYFGASPFNNHVPPTWLPVLPVAFTCHQKRADHYVFGCLATREMPKVLESFLVFFGTAFGSRPGPTQDCWAAGLHCNKTAAQCGCCAAGPQGCICRGCLLQGCSAAGLGPVARITRLRMQRRGR